MKNLISFLCLIISCWFSLTNAHGRLWEPAARSTAWRVDSSFPKYYDDNQMSCGGTDVQWDMNGGKCGICGEPYSGSPKKFEKGGKYYTGKSVETYKQGQTIDAHVELTMPHLGWFEFRICNIDNMASDATQECLDKTLLGDTDGETRFPVDDSIKNYYFKLVLPSDLSCKQCVFQWKYHTGNSWGVDAETGKGCVGCGARQEEFYGCSDVTITSDDGTNVVRPPARPTTTGKRIITTIKTTTKSPKTNTRKGVLGDSKCSNGDGFFADYDSGCTQYYACLFTGTPSERIFYKKCPGNLLFDNGRKVCTYANEVNCDPSKKKRFFNNHIFD